MSMVNGEVRNLNAREGSRENNNTSTRWRQDEGSLLLFLLPQVRMETNNQKLAYIHRLLRIQP